MVRAVTCVICLDCRYFQGTTDFVFEAEFFPLHLLSLERCSNSAQAFEELSFVTRPLVPDQVVMSRRVLQQNFFRWLVARDIANLDVPFELRSYHRTDIDALLEMMQPSVHQYLEEGNKQLHDSYCKEK